MILDKILLAEDNEFDAELTLEALRSSNLINDIDWVKDGQEAIDYLTYKGKYSDRKRGNPLFILLDIRMPRKSGLEVLREVKSNDNLKKIPIVFLTASREERDLYEGYNNGANAYVVKPVDYTKFIDVVNDIGKFWAVINEQPET